jgi:tRNA dimethylallyltransferase
MQLFEEIRQFLLESVQLNKKPLIAILGPTASGKTALSLKIAKEFRGEIISADSRQIYRYMDIGTDKIPVSMQEGVRHYLLDIIEPNGEFTVADFKRMTLKIMSEIHARQNVPILCGGTGLYLDAVIENYQIPQIPPQYDIRQKLAQYYEQHGATALHELLKERDPETAARIHPNNVRYVIRALEINIVGGDRKQDRKGGRMFNVLKIGIDWPRELLYERINRRVDNQLERGLLNEVKNLLMKGYHEKLPAMSSLGYLELVNHIKGEKPLQEAVEDIKRNTRNYAKRQMTWFRRYTDIKWIGGEELESVLKAAAPQS